MLYNLSVVKKLGGDEDIFVRKLIYIFINSIIPELNQFNEAYENKDLKMLAIRAHSIKSNFDLFNVTSMKKTIRILENKDLLTTLDSNEIASYVTEVNTTIHAVIAEMKQDYPPC